MEGHDHTGEAEDAVESNLDDVAMVSHGEVEGIVHFLEEDGEMAVETSSLVPWVVSREVCNIYQALDGQSDQGEDEKNGDGLSQEVQMNFSLGRDPYNDVLDHYQELLHLLHVALDLLHVALDLLHVVLDPLSMTLDFY